VLRAVLKGEIDEIALQDVGSCKAYKCRPITSNRGDHEKYLGQDWYRLVKDRKLAEGDRLILDIANTPIGMYVEVVPRCNGL